MNARFPRPQTLGAALISGILLQAGTFAQSLTECVDRGLKHAPSVRRSMFDAKSATADVGVALAPTRPSLSVEGSFGVGLADRTVDGIPTAEGDTLAHRRAGFTFQQLLYDFGSSSKLVEAAWFRKLYSDFLVTDAAENRALEVVEVYLNVLRYRLHVKLNEQKLSDLEGYLEKAAGQALKEGNGDKLILEGRIANTKADLARSKSLVMAAEGRFRILTKLSPDNLALPRLPDVGGLYGRSENHPKLQAAKQAIEAGRLTAEGLARDFYPKFFFEVQGHYGKDVYGTRGPDRGISGLAVMRWDALDGGKRKSLLEQAEAERDKQHAILEEIKDALEDDVNKAKADLIGARARYKKLSGSIESLESGLSTLEEQVKNNRGKLTSVISAYTEKSSSRRELVDANFDAYRAAFEVLAAGGQLLEYLNVEFSPDRVGKDGK